MSLCKQVLQRHPGRVRCFLLECTELPMFADDVRAATGLPVFDAITCCDLFINGRVDNPRFGIDSWQHGFFDSMRLEASMFLPYNLVAFRVIPAALRPQCTAAACAAYTVMLSHMC